MRPSIAIGVSVAIVLAALGAGRHPGEDLGGGADAGAITILRSKSGGLLTGTGSRTLNESTSGVPDGPEEGDRFGGALHLSSVSCLAPAA